MAMLLGITLFVFMYVCQTGWNWQLGASHRSLSCVAAHILRAYVCMALSNPESIQTKAVLF